MAAEIFTERTAPEPLITEEQIRERVAEMGKQITSDYDGKQLTLLVVLKGGMIHAADLVRKIDPGRVDIDIEFVQISTYNDGRESSRNATVVPIGELNLSGKNVLGIEDIVDTGYSIEALDKFCKEQGVSNFATVCMVSKKGRREVDVGVTYVGFEIPNVWVEGYGLDTAQKGRGYPFIGVRNSS